MASIADWCCFVGFDYHDRFVQVCVLDAAGEVLGNQRIANDISKILEYVNNMRDGRMIRGAAVETCCGASHFAEPLRKHDWPVELAHAGICSKMKQSPDKSDLADAHLLADLCRVGYLPRVWLPPQEIRDLRRLGRYRQQLVSKVREVERRMEEATASDPVVQKLRATKGVGLVTAVVMRSEIGSFDRFACGKQLARYQPTWKQMKEDLKKRGKPASVAAAAVANRWVRKLFWEMREVEEPCAAA